MTNQLRLINELKNEKCGRDYIEDGAMHRGEVDNSFTTTYKATATLHSSLLHLLNRRCEEKIHFSNFYSGFNGDVGGFATARQDQRCLSRETLTPPIGSFGTSIEDSLRHTISGTSSNTSARWAVNMLPGSSITTALSKRRHPQRPSSR